MQSGRTYFSCVLQQLVLTWNVTWERLDDPVKSVI